MFRGVTRLLLGARNSGCCKPSQLSVLRGGALRHLALALLLWSASADLAVASIETASAPAIADKILVLKGKRQLELLSDGVVLKSYPIALGPQARGPKRASGDGRTPEGLYLIDGRHAQSPYHLALHISYPSAADEAHAAAAHRDPGGDIFIHGLPADYGHADPVRFYKDWTEGCIAVGNTAIEEIWNAVRDGTPIEIRP
jgi:murein L,D-transpeptidase YafK